MDEIERDILLTRDRLAASVDELVGRLQPQALTQQARRRAQLLVFDEHGQLRLGRVAAVAGTVAVVLLTRWLRARRHR